MRNSGLTALVLLAPVLIAGAAAVGCANPADDKPEAVVGDAAPMGAPETGGDHYSISGGTIGFVGSKVTGSHEGGFREFGGEIRLVDSAPENSTVKITIDTRSIWADSEKLTGHLRSPDFFDVENHPSAIFASKSIAREGDAYLITGNLDLHGITKSISFPAQITIDDGGISARAEFSIKRFDWGIVYPGKADDLIRDEVVIKLDLTAVPTAG